METMRKFVVWLGGELKNNYDSTIAISVVIAVALFFIYGVGITATVMLLIVTSLLLFIWYKHKTVRAVRDFVMSPRSQIIIILITLTFIAVFNLIPDKHKSDFLLAIMQGIIIVGVFTAIQLRQNANIANRQHYRDAIGFLSSGSPAVRRKGVEDLYEYAKENNDKAEEIWKILNGHVKYFTRDKSYQASFPNEPAGDIELILKIQSSTDYINEKDYPFKNIRIIDWQYAWLRGANLTGAHLQGANLWKTQLQKTLLSKTQLQSACLVFAQLHGTHLQSAQLQEANLQKTKLQGADLQDAQLQGAKLQNTQLQGANLYHAQLQEAVLRDTQLHGVCSSQDRGLSKFEKEISEQAGAETEMNSVIFEGMTADHLSVIEKK